MRIRTAILFKLLATAAGIGLQCGMMELDAQEVSFKNLSSNSQTITDMPGQARGLLMQVFRPGFRFTSGEILSSASYTRGLYSNDILTTNYFLQQSSGLNSSVEISGIPFLVSYTRRSQLPLPWLSNEPQNWFKYSFDVSTYQKKWMQLAEKLGPEALTKSGSELKRWKDDFRSSLNSTIEQKAKQKFHHQFDSLTHQLDPALLAGKSQAEYAKQFFGQDLSNLKANAQAELDKARNRDSIAANDSMVLIAEEKLADVNEKIAYVESVHTRVEKLRTSGGIEKIKALELKSKEEYDELIKDPASLVKKLSSQYNLGGFSKVMSMLSALRIGGHAVPFSSSAMPLLSNGISMEMNVADKYLAVATGKLISVGSEWNYLAGQPDPQKQNQPGYWSVNYHVGKISKTHKGIKLTSVTGQSNEDNTYVAAGTEPKRNLLVSIYSRERIFGDTWLNLEASKSSVSGGLPKQDMLNLDNMSFRISAEGTVAPAGIRHQLWYNKINGAFNDFSGYRGFSGGYETGLSFNWKPLKKKWSANIRGNARKYKTPGVFGPGSWNSRDIRTSFSYKLKRSQSFKLSIYGRDGVKQYEFANHRQIIRQKSTGATSDIYLVNPRIFGLYNTSMFSIGYSNDRFPYTGAAGDVMVASQAWNGILNQTFLYGEHLLQLNVFYTKVINPQQQFLFDTRLDADAGGSFKISDDLSVQTACVFGYLKGAYTNIGLRSGISARMFRKFSLDLNADMRQHIKLENPLFEQFVNVNCDLKYTLK